MCSNALEPGWAPIRMGGPGAPDDMDQARRTQVWLAVGDDPEARTTGGHFRHMRRLRPNPQAEDADVQDRLIELCAKVTGVPLPA